MKQPPFLIGLCVMFLVGALDMTRSISGPLLQGTFNLTYAELGILFASVSIGYLLGSLICGWALDRIGIQKAVLAGLLVTAVGLCIATFGHWFGAALIGFALSGLGSGWMEVGVNAVIPAVAKADTSQAGMFNVLHGLYGVGAFVFPVAGSWLITILSGWKPLFILLSVCFTLVLLAALIVKFPKSQEHSGVETPAEVIAESLPGTHAIAASSNPTESAKPSREPLPWSWALIGLLMAITTYVMAEAGIGAWLPTYLVHARRFTLAQSSLYLSGFYLTFTIGRLTGHFWVNRFGHRRAVIWSSILAGVLILVGEWNTSLTYVFIAAGLGFAVIFPTITAIATETFPQHSSRVLGLLFTSGGLGSMVVNWLIGGLASWFGLSISFLLIPISLGLTIVGIYLARKSPAVSRRAATAQ